MNNGKFNILSIFGRQIIVIVDIKIKIDYDTIIMYKYFDPLYTYLVPIVSPTRPFHFTVLYIEREVFHIHFAGRSVYSVGEPRHLSVGSHYHVRVDCRRAVLGVSAGHTSAIAVILDYYSVILNKCTITILRWVVHIL